MAARTIDGFLFVGDPHLTSRRPGRRKDADFGRTVLAKIEQCVRIANDRNLQLVFLGDLFDRPTEENESLKPALVRLLMGLRYVAISNLGNHEIISSALSDSDTISILDAGKSLRIQKASGLIGVFTLASDGEEMTVALGATPFGQIIPDDVSEHLAQADTVIWLTHHDIAFDGSYPGAQEPFEIQGCGLVVNGHMHAPFPAIERGETTWFNPGNITRLSVDTMDHEPTVWESSASGEMTPDVLDHEKAVFDLTGRLLAEGKREARARIEDDASVFVDLLEKESPADLRASADGSLIAELIAAKFVHDQTPPAVQNLVKRLLSEALEAS